MDAAHRNYKGRQHKPEVIDALSDTFNALCGFRAVAEIQETLHKLGNGRVPQSLKVMASSVNVRTSAGDFLFVMPEELRIEIDTGGEVFVATTPLSGSDSVRNYKQAWRADPLFEKGR